MSITSAFVVLVVSFAILRSRQDNLNSALNYIECDRSKKAITLIEESLAVLKKPAPN
jgi:hypothetical protein